MLDSLQFMASFQLGNPLCELIAGFPFEMTADLFTFGYSASIVIFFFLTCHIIFTIYYVQAKERKFSALNETQRAILCFTLRGVCVEDKNPSLLSQEASIDTIFVFTCIQDLKTHLKDLSTLFLQGWLSKKRILLKLSMG